MNDTKYTPVLVSYSLRNSKQPGFCQNSQVPRPLRITRLSEPFVGFPNNVRRRGVADGSEAHDGVRDGGGSAGNRRRRMYDGTYVRRHTGQEQHWRKNSRYGFTPYNIRETFFFQASHFIRRLEVLRSNLSILIPKYLAYLLSHWGQLKYQFCNQ